MFLGNIWETFGKHFGYFNTFYYLCVYDVKLINRYLSMRYNSFLKYWNIYKVFSYRLL